MTIKTHVITIAGIKNLHREVYVHALDFTIYLKDLQIDLLKVLVNVHDDKTTGKLKAIEAIIKELEKLQSEVIKEYEADESKSLKKTFDEANKIIKKGLK